MTSLLPAHPVRPPVRLSRAGAAGVALLSALLLVLGAMLAPPALAHDTLISTDPEDGATLDAAPETITLTYSANVLEVSPVVRIADEGGSAAVDLKPTVEGPHVTAPVPGDLSAGKHTVQWRVVSSDGHPIEGSFTFTTKQGAEKPGQPAGDGASGSASDGASGGASDGGAAETTRKPAEPSSSPSATAKQSSGQGSSLMPWLLGGILVIALGGGAVALVLSRRKG